MNLATFHAHNVVNLNSAYSQRIGDERTVTTPGTASAHMIALGFCPPTHQSV
jgi:hypothetical protein